MQQTIRQQIAVLYEIAQLIAFINQSTLT